MSESSNRLTEEFAEIQRCFADHPQISVVSTEGSPVNQYVIEYRVNGLVQLDDGEVVQSDQHRIELSLSFGFPHFPPNCKPLTQIFHPDIDPSAIKIAEFWNDSTRLTDLIYHIGKMICWQIYSAKDGFNQLALDWLKANKDSVPMDTIQLETGTVSGDELPEVDLDLGFSTTPDIILDTSPAASSESEIELHETSSDDTSDSSFIGDIDFNFVTPEESGGFELELSDSDTASESSDGALELSLDEPPPAKEKFELADDIDFNFNPSSSSDELELGLADSTTDQEDGPLELTLENENIQPVEKENFSFVAAGADDVEEEGSVDIDLDPQLPLDETDFSPSFPVNMEDDVVDLDLSVVDVDYDILKGMIDQRNYIAAQKKLATMAVENISTPVSALKPLVEQRVERAADVHAQAMQLESEGLLEDAAKKLEAVLNLVQDYPNLEQDMKRVRDAWAALNSPTQAESSLSLEQPEAAPAEARDTMLTHTVVSSPGGAASGSGDSGQKKTPPKEKKRKEDSFSRQKKNKPLIIAALGILVGLSLSGWFFVEWRSFSQADQRWSEINSLLEKNEYQKAKEQCEEIRVLLSRVKLIMGGGKKALLGQVDDLLESEHFLEGLEGKILYQGQYISKRAHRAYVDIQDLVEEAERRGALSKWQESAELYGKAFEIAESNKTRLDTKFYDEVMVGFKNATFANLVSLGKKAFISRHWPLAIEKFEAALKLAQEDGVADPSISYDVNRYLQRALFSQYVIDGDKALRAADFSTSAAKFTKAYDIAKDSNLIDNENRQKVLVKLKQSSLIKLMGDAEGYVTDRRWQEAVQAYTQAKKYTMDGYPLVDMGVAESQERVEGLLVSAIIGMERDIIAIKRGTKQYAEVEKAFDRILMTIDQSSLRDEPSLVKMRSKMVEDKEKVHLKGIVEEQMAYLQENYRSIVADNFTGVSLKALSNPHISFLGQEERALSFKIRCREQRESKYYTLELIYQYDIDLHKWGFPEM